MGDWTPSIEDLQEREDEEWLRVEREYCGRLLAYAQRRTGDHQASEDIVQETLLGAVRGIDDFDPHYSFEQYLFGICRNRTIDHLRRKKARTIQVGEDDDGFPGMEALATQSETPSAIIRGRELSERAQELLGSILHDWVEETWEQGEFLRLCVIEALFSGGWRNRDTWKRFELRDETAVAGIKFRALKRLRQLAAVRESGNDLLAFLGKILRATKGTAQRLGRRVVTHRCAATATFEIVFDGRGRNRGLTVALRRLGAAVCAEQVFLVDQRAANRTLIK